MSAALFWLVATIIALLLLGVFNLRRASSPAPIDYDDSDFDDTSDWPRRLLHVPTMTLYKWSPGNIYGGFRNPNYIAIFYTWGRFELRDLKTKLHVKAVPIRGVLWSVPRIDPEEHFTAEEFQRAIRMTIGTTD